MPSPEDQLNAFLEHNIVDYLIGDINTMRTAGGSGASGASGPIGPEPPAPRGGKLGGVAYPLLMSVFSGIELLGALTYTIDNPAAAAYKRGQSEEHFCHYWEEYLYPTGAEKKVGRPLYVLVRCAIAHSFALKGGIWIEKGASPSRHLTYDASENAVYLDAIQLADRFKRTYFNEIDHKILKVPGSPKAASMANQLQLMEGEYQVQQSDSDPNKPNKPKKGISNLYLLAPTPSVHSGGTRGVSGPAQPPSGSFSGATGMTGPPQSGSSGNGAT